MRFPVMGDIMLSQQTIFVDREARESGLSAADKILKVVQNEEFPRVVIYPEGNTSNGRQVASFKLGAFQPVRQATTARSFSLSLHFMSRVVSEQSRARVAAEGMSGLAF